MQVRLRNMLGSHSDCPFHLLNGSVVARDLLLNLGLVLFKVSEPLLQMKILFALCRNGLVVNFTDVLQSGYKVRHVV